MPWRAGPQPAVEFLTRAVSWGRWPAVSAHEGILVEQAMLGAVTWARYGGLAEPWRYRAWPVERRHDHARQGGLLFDGIAPPPRRALGAGRWLHRGQGWHRRAASPLRPGQDVRRADPGELRAGRRRVVARGFGA